MTEAASLTDGPILDLKAKRLSDAADAAKPGAKPDTGKENAGASASAKDAARETPKDTAKAAPARGGAGFGSVAASGLIGGLIGAGLLYGVTTYQRGADPRLVNLDKSLAGLATKDAVAGLDKRLAANEQALKPLPDAVARAETAAKAAADRANEALQKAGVAPATAPSADGSAPAPAVPADIAARLDALDQRVSALQEEPGRDGTAEVKSAQTMDPAALDDRLKALETNGGKSAASDLSDKIAALQADVASRAKADEAAEAALGKRVDEVQKALDARIAAATQTVQEATQASKQAADTAQTRADEAVKGLERKLQEQSERIAGLDKAVDQTAKQSTVQSALRIVAADRIASALEAGQPYPDALASLRNLEPSDSKRLDALGPFADKGAPTASGLAAEFRRISEKIAEAKRAAQAKSVAETGSVGDRLMNMASSLVQVKRADGPTAGGTQAAAGSAASTAQVQAALDRGDLAEAAKAYAALPEEARAQGGDFGTRLSARAEAGRAAQALLADAFTGLPPAR
ncbi:COG4223 family protein [Methylorubrum extorquens]